MDEQKQETVRERLLKEYYAAIGAVLGETANKPYRKYIVGDPDLLEISRKVKFYLDE